jgi:hemerythrin
MEYIRWKEELSVGNDEMDNQHKELFRLINAFYNNIAGNSGKAAILQAIIDLEKYTKVHFSQEEVKMQRSLYPAFAGHQKEHLKFIETVEDFKRRYEEGRLLLPLEVGGFIKDWIINHIMKTDMAYKGNIR